MLLSVSAVAATLWVCQSLAKPLPAAQVPNWPGPVARRSIPAPSAALSSEVASLLSLASSLSAAASQTSEAADAIKPSAPASGAALSSEVASLLSLASSLSAGPAPSAAAPASNPVLSSEVASLLSLASSLSAAASPTSAAPTSSAALSSEIAHLLSLGSSLSAAAPASTAVQQKAASGIPTPTGSECLLYTQPLQTFTWSYYPSGATTLAYSSATYTAQLACTCGNGEMAGVYTKVDNIGDKRVYCATGTASSQDAVSTTVPTGTPGNANNAAWADVSCTYGSLNDESSNPQDQWNDAGAAAAWNDLTIWAAGQTGDQSNILSNYFHGRPAPNCAELENSNCEVTVNCGQHNFPNAPINSPAGYVIFNSMIGVHSVYEAAYSAINDAMPQVLANVGNLVSACSPISGEILAQQKLKVTLDIVQGILTFVLAPLFHAALGKLQYFVDNPTSFSVGVDSSYGALGATMAAVKDSMTQLSPLPIQNDISATLSNLTTSWLNATTIMNKNVFDNLDTLGTLIDNGTFFTSSNDIGPLDASIAMEKALIAALLPMIWITGDNPAYPVILTSEGLTSTGGCSGYDPSSTFSSSGYSGNVDLDSNALSSGLICDGDSAYWLVGVNTNTVEFAEPPHGSPVIEHNIHVAALPGLDTLTQYQGLTVSEVALNAINSWTHNGDKNGWSLPDATDPSFISTITTTNIGTSYGLVDIPVCSWTDMESAALDDSGDNPFYPCPSP